MTPARTSPPQAHSEYRLRHPATPFYAASISSTATVRVGVRLTARSNRTGMAPGRTASIAGQVVPAHRGQRVRLQQKQGRTWRTMQAKPLAATGRYSFALRPRATGTSWWRIYKASDSDHIGAISRTFRLVVYRAAITGIHANATGDDRRAGAAGDRLPVPGRAGPRSRPGAGSAPRVRSRSIRVPPASVSRSPGRR